MKMLLKFVLSVFVLTVSFAIAHSVGPAPKVVESFPANDSTDVKPGTMELRVTFSQPMEDKSWSWAYENKDEFPEVAGGPRYLDDQRTAVLPVRLEANRRYTIWINKGSFQNFKDQSGNPAVPYKLTFETGDAETQD